MNIGICIISHNSEEDIFKYHKGYPTKVGDNNYFVVIVDNVGSDTLEKFTEENNYHYVKNETPHGFGENNNIGFDYLKQFNLDFFQVLNPDVDLDFNEWSAFVERKSKTDFDICGAKVIEDGDFKLASHNRKIPCIFDAFVSLVFKKKLFLRDPNEFSYPDWVGGSFMLVRASTYEAIGGFDTSFFMYYEDADICVRAKKAGYIIHYDPSFSFYHAAHRAGHKLFSDHFFWNLTSMFKFFRKHFPYCAFSRMEWKG